MEEQSQISIRIIEDEMKEAYMSYAMSVIVGRALPDARDGLKPVHRRILYAMHDLGMRHNQPFKKSARIVGEVLGKYHPHGDSAVYDAIVRMAQDFSLRYPLIDGQGNWGSIDGDPAAAQRYTECRLKRASHELLADLEKDTVSWTGNFDGSLQEPTLLPGPFPNLLVNGSSGIAVGMATNMPPHNLNEVADAITAALKNPEISVQELMTLMPAPDFPTGGIICGQAGILHAYSTGRGRIVLRGVIEREEHKDRTALVITEIPFQVIKADLVEQIADLVRDKRIEGIADIRDESDRDGMRVFIQLKRDANADVIENHLYKYTRLQVTFGIHNLAIINNEPKVFSLPELLQTYIQHRRTVIRHRTQFDLNKAQEQAHVLEGLLIALENIDPIIALIKKSKDAAVARQGLIHTYTLSDRQATAILDMRLQKLTGLEQQAIRDEHAALQITIADLKDVLARPERVDNIIIDDLIHLKQRYGDARRTRIMEMDEDIDIEDLIDEESMVVTISHRGYSKRLSLDTYQAQRRGGVGVIGTTTREDDFVEHLFVASTHSSLLFFTNSGKVYWQKVYRIPESGRQARGTPLVNMLSLSPGERVSAVIAVDRYSEDQYLMFATKQGYIKKTALSAYSRPRAGGIHAIKLEEDDDLVHVVLTEGTSDLLLASRDGQAIRFAEQDVRPMGRVSRGVIGMRLRPGDEIVSLSNAARGQVLTVTRNGYGKRTPVEEYRVQGRGGFGVRNIMTNGRNGPVVAVRVVQDADDLLLMSQNGIMIRTSAVEISSMGRSTQGVRIMRLRPGDAVSSVAKVLVEEESL